MTSLSAPKDSRAGEPDLEASCIKLLARAMPRYLPTLLTIPSDGMDLLELALVGLGAPETMLQGAAADFWVPCPLHRTFNIANALLGQFRTEA